MHTVAATKVCYSPVHDAITHSGTSTYTQGLPDGSLRPKDIVPLLLIPANG